jgi:uncharacterized protein YndB with AHSA1/START domain
MKWVAIILGSTVGLLLLAVIGLWIAGHRKDAGKLDTSVDIQRPAAEVWPWLTEPEKQKQWVSWLVEARDLTPPPIKVGSRKAWVMVDPNMNNRRLKINTVVTAVVPERELSLQIDSQGMFTSHGTYTLTALPGGGTRLRTAAEYSYPHWFARLMEPLVAPQARKKMNSDMAQLKHLVETAAQAQMSVSPANAK